MTSLPNEVAIIIASLKLALPPALLPLGNDVPNEVPIRVKEDELPEPDPDAYEDPGGGSIVIGMGAGIVMEM